jgi:DNA-binding response OmpR family regulator
LKQLKELPATAMIPVVIVSVIPASDQPLRVDAAQGWVQKPFNENVLLAELGRVLKAKGGSGYTLLVEQDQGLAQMILDGFADEGVRLEHSSTLQQAVDRCLLGAPNLLILDLTLPDGDGFSLVDWLRRQPALQTLPLVVYSSREITEAEMLKLRLGPTQFLSKAKVQPQEVEELVLAMLQRMRHKTSATVY